MSDTVTGLLIGLMLVIPAVVAAAVLNLVYRYREKRDGLRD